MAFDEQKKPREQTKPLSATEARQGVRGTHLFTVLVTALVLAAIVWAGVEIWGRYIEPGAPPNSSPTISSSSGQPQAGTIDNTPPAGQTAQPGHEEHAGPAEPRRNAELGAAFELRMKSQDQ